MRIAIVEWPEGLRAGSPQWQAIEAQVRSSQIDLLVTNELPFGIWIADEPAWDTRTARRSVQDHAEGLEALADLRLPAIVSSRPVITDDRLKNQAFVLQSREVRPLHHKRYFPQEPGWHESVWYAHDQDAFRTSMIRDVRVGVLLCTDAMFNEHARAYGNQQTHLIAMPRAAGASTDKWLAAGKMAALVSGCYVVSSNRSGLSSRGTQFGGAGFGYRPDSSLIEVTTPQSPLCIIDIDPGVAREQQRCYPCYVRGP